MPKFGLHLGLVASLWLCACEPEPNYWQPDLRPHECSKTRKTCDPASELCFEGTCTPTCWADADCPAAHTCEPISDELETWRVCFAD